MFNKESERYLSDDHRKNGDQAFESAFSNQGPEFDPCFAIDTLKCELDVGLLMSITKRKRTII